MKITLYTNNHDISSDGVFMCEIGLKKLTITHFIPKIGLSVKGFLNISFIYQEIQNLLSGNAFKFKLFFSILQQKPLDLETVCSSILITFVNVISFEGCSV